MVEELQFSTIVSKEWTRTPVRPAIVVLLSILWSRTANILPALQKYSFCIGREKRDSRRAYCGMKKWKPRASTLDRWWTMMHEKLGLGRVAPAQPSYPLRSQA